MLPKEFSLGLGTDLKAPVSQHLLVPTSGENEAGSLLC